MENMLALKKISKKPLFWLLLFALLLTACTGPIEALPEVVESPTASPPPPTPIPEEPTATPQPSAAIVNDEVIPLAWFEREVERYLLAQAAMGNENIDEDLARQTVLNDLIDQVLLAQGAREAGGQVSDAEVQAQIDQLGEDVDLDTWMAEWGYSREELFEALRLQMLVANQRDRITDSIPETVEQVELRQIFAFTQAGANRAVAALNAGRSFEEVAFEFSPDTGGYLGWIPRGYLLVKDVEDVVFDLPVGSYSEIIESDIGFHIVLVIDREVRPLTPDARLTLERQALFTWLEDRRAASLIEVLID